MTRSVLCVAIVALCAAGCGKGGAAPADTPKKVSESDLPSGEKVLERDGEAPVVQVEKGMNAALRAAQETARERWPEFEAAVKAANPRQQRFVKVPITAGETTEHIWVEVTKLEGEKVTGRLANAPVDLPGLKEGSVVTVGVNDVEDWMISSDDGVLGFFSKKALEDAARKR